MAPVTFMTGFSTRSAVAGDMAQLSVLARAHQFSPYRTYTGYGTDIPELAQRYLLRNLEAAVTHPDHVVLLAEADDGVIGMLWAERNGFDADHLGVDVLRVKALFGPDDFDDRRSVGAALLDTALDQHAALFLLDVDAADVHLLAAAQSVGFDVFDTSMTYLAVTPVVTDHPRDRHFELTAHDREHPPGLSDAEVDRMATDSAVSFQGSHFFADPRLDPRRCAGLYDRWARNLLQGDWADWLMIVRDSEGPQGVLGLRTVPFMDGADGVTMLGDAFGFATWPRGQGVGSSMVRFYVRHAPATLVESTTQVRTTPLLVTFPEVMRFKRSNYVLHGWSPHLGAR